MEEQDVEVNMENLQGKKQEDILKGSFKAGASVHDRIWKQRKVPIFTAGNHLQVE